MSSENSPSKSVAETAFVVFAVMFAVGAVFWDQILDSVGDSLNTSKSVVVTSIDDVQFLTRRKGFELRSMRDDIELVKVSDLKAAAPTSVGVPVSFVLTNTGGANEFPSIRIYLTSITGRRVRAIDFRPTDYAHDKRFEVQKVDLLLSRQGGETGFTVEPYYGVAP